MCYRNIEGKGQTYCYTEQVLWEVTPDFDVRGVFAIDASGQDRRWYYETRNEAENAARDGYIKAWDEWNAEQDADDLDFETATDSYHF